MATKMAMDMDRGRRRKLIDFHSHILPGIDDGSKSTEMSLQMLRMSQAQGVEHIIATPHFYASKTSPEHFLARRQRAWEKLQAAMEESETAEISHGMWEDSASQQTEEGAFRYVFDTLDAMPQISLGAEVYYFSGISRTDELKELRVQGTRILLLEMPFHRWTNSMIDEAAALASDDDYTVVMAHIDRYLNTTDKDTWLYLADCGALFQMNAGYINGGWMQKRHAVRLIKDGIISVIASDCHNTDSRKPNLGEAADVIEKELGAYAVTRLMNNAAKLLAAER